MNPILFFLQISLIFIISFGLKNSLITTISYLFSLSSKLLRIFSEILSSFIILISTKGFNNDNLSKTDYSEYFGTWYDDEKNEFIVRNIGNDLITFTWFIYRIASIDDVTLPFKNNKAVFYYHGYDDKNYNDKNDDDEFYCRKATVELKDNSISIKVENSTLAESNKNISQDKTDLFGGGSYIQPGQYNFTTKK